MELFLSPKAKIKIYKLDNILYCNLHPGAVLDIC